LALALGMTVGELSERMGAGELVEWMAYYSIEPFGAERDNLHAGIVASVVANANRDPKRKPVKPDDFMLKPARRRNVSAEFDALVAFVKSNT
jgi:hypothetical protein